MSKSIKCFLYIGLILLSFFLVDSDLDVAASNINYSYNVMPLDVYFSNISTSSGTDVSISSSGDSIDLGNIVLKNKGDIETITYEITNNKSKYDVSIDILINGLKVYRDDNFIVKCNDFGILEKGTKKSGTITIELINNVIDEANLPLDFTINVNPIYNRFNFFN